MRMVEKLKKTNLKEYFDKDLRLTLIFAVFGIILGYLSFIINQPKLNIILVAVVLGALYQVLKKLLKIKQPFKWWLGNGIIIYILLWFVVWTILYNIRIV